MILTLAHGDDPLAKAADWFHEQVADRHRRIGFLLAVAEEAARARRLLLDHPRSGDGVLLPDMHSLKSFIDARHPPEGNILNTHGQELMLVEVLKSQGFPWQMADELLRWFEALQLSEHTPQDFDTAMSEGAQTAFSADTQKLKLLWSAWQEQLRQENATTQSITYSAGLQHVELDDNEQLILLGYDWLHSRELSFVARHMRRGQLTVVLCPESPLHAQLVTADFSEAHAPATGQTDFLDSLFSDNGKPLQQRAQQVKASNPTRPALQVFTASGNEQEAQAIDIQTRLWLAEGCRSIAVVTEDRRLARRCSALLARAGIPVSDSAGWPLSTTTAAGALERWLETVETDFNHEPLLDVLKSSFLINPAVTSDTVHSLQLDIIEREGIPQSLARYREAVAQRQHALANMPGAIRGDLDRLLDILEDAAAPLLSFIDAEPQPPEQFLQTLTQSLRRLGLWQGYEKDAAGQRILQELFDMTQALQHRQLRFSWEEFRGWLSRALETHNFRPQPEAGPVRIMNYEQSRLGSFDAIILAGSTSHNLPGGASRHIFFNETVRHELGLKTWETSRQQRFSQFRRLLQAAPSVMLSWTKENDGIPAQPTPWLALLQTFHQHVFGDDAENGMLQALLPLPAARVPTPFSAPVPTRSARPAPTLPRKLVPGRISIHGYQQLVRCPYQFFASRGLRLQAREEIAEKLGKREYGSLVHLCLQALHSDVASLPGPFKAVFTEHSRDDAIALLQKISNQVFEPEHHQDFESQAQWRHWEALIPRIIDWEIKHAADGWRVFQTETDYTTALGKSQTELTGKLDRIDRKASGERSLLDYKTGKAPNPAAVLSGEDVQLVSYAMLADDISEAGYLELAEKPAKKRTLDGDGLNELMPKMRDRFSTIADAIHGGAGLPAWGDEATACRYCAMRGLCRLGEYDDPANDRNTEQ